MSGNRFLLDDLGRIKRRARWRIQRFAQRCRYPGLDANSAPILFVNSFPKCGTHLLKQAVTGLSEIGPFVEAPEYFIPTYEVSTGSKRTQTEILEDLNSLRPGDIQIGHLHATQENQAFLCRPDVGLFFIYRDPRDVVVSHAFYITSMTPTHVHHDFYVNKISTLDERIRVSILGRPELKEIEFPDIRKRFVPYMRWLECEEALAIRFEDFIRRRMDTLRRIWRHFQRCGYDLGVSEEQALIAMKENINPASSPTYRSGKVGSWQEYFSEENKALFKEVSGGLLIELGYEEDFLW